MSSPSFSPITTPLDALHATDELNVDKLLESSPPPEDDEPEEDTILASPNGEVSTTIGGESDINSDAMATGTGVLATGHSLRSELVRARRACERNKLSPYQVEQIESFTKTSPLARDVDVRVELSAIRNLLAAIVAAIPPFAVKGPLAENLRSYSMAVLLSSKLSAYKGNVPRDLVYSIIVKQGLHLPSNLNQDVYARRVIRSFIQEELTQARAKIKKAVSETVRGRVAQKPS